MKLILIRVRGKDIIKPIAPLKAKSLLKVKKKLNEQIEIPSGVTLIVLI